MNRTASSTVQKWGNSLAIRIPATLARQAHFVVGQPVEIYLDNLGVVVHREGPPKLSLEQRVALFDTEKHGGEVLTSASLGAELI